MTAGFQLFTPSGITQIDGDFLNTSLTGHGHITVSATPTNPLISTLVYAWKQGSIAFNAVNPMVAFCCSVPTIMVSCVKQGAVYTATFLCATTGAVDLEYFIFDQTPTIGTTFGLQVFNASGALVYDSNFAYSRILNFVTGGTSPLYPPNSPDRTGPAPIFRVDTYDRKIAICQAGPLTVSKNAYTDDTGPDPGDEITTTIWGAVSAWTVNTVQTAFQWRQFGVLQTPFQVSSYGSGDYYYLIFDVSAVA